MSELPQLASRLVDRRLDNGLRFVLLEQRDNPLVALNLWYHVGSKDDPPGLSGLAHLFEHMLFQGSEHVETNGHFRYVQQVGGSANGSTSLDRTNYYETLPAHCLELGLWLESDRLGYLLPALDADKFEGQRSVVINERRQRIDNQPYGRAFETLQLALFGNDHPYSWPIIGHLDDLHRISLEDVRSFFSSFYAPDNAVLTLVGDFDSRTTEAQIARYFGEIPASGPAPRKDPAPPRTDRRLTFLHDEVALTRLYFAWTAPAFSHPDRAVGELLASLLAAGKSSPLYQTLVHRNQLAQDVSAFLLPLELCSLFAVVATVRPDIDPQRVEDEIIANLAAAADGRLPDQDFRRARNQILAGFFQELESVESLADLLSQCTVLGGGPETIDAEAKRYFEIQPAEVEQFARDHLAADDVVRLRIDPRPAHDA